MQSKKQGATSAVPLLTIRGASKAFPGVQALSDGKYVDTVKTSETPTESIISMMVGRKIKGQMRPSSKTDSSEVALSVKGFTLSAGGDSPAGWVASHRPRYRRKAQLL